MVYILLIIGLIMILVGANIFTEASSSLAKRFNISDFIIGLTVVGIGTSMPEFTVSLIAALKGSGDIAIGNVVGSNIFNSLAIIGLVVIVSPIALTGSNIRKDLPICVGASALLLLVAAIAHFSGREIIGRLEGLILVAMFVMFIVYTVREGSKQRNQNAETSEPQQTIKQRPMWFIILMMVLGLCALVAGGEFFLSSATQIAKQLNISDAVIAITIMSAGTSMPELATCLVAAAKGKGDMALGNVVGSNISNILLVIGGSAAITPLSFGGITLNDIIFVLITAILLFVAAFTFKKRKIDRFEGTLFIIMYVIYIYQRIQ